MQEILELATSKEAKICTKPKTALVRARVKIEGNMNALEATQTRIDARIDAHENDTSSSSSGGRKENEQNSIRAVATGFGIVHERILKRSDQRTCDGRKTRR